MFPGRGLRWVRDLGHVSKLCPQWARRLPTLPRRSGPARSAGERGPAPEHLSLLLRGDKELSPRGDPGSVPPSWAHTLCYPVSEPQSFNLCPKELWCFGAVWLIFASV